VFENLVNIGRRLPVKLVERVRGNDDGTSPLRDAAAKANSISLGAPASAGTTFIPSFSAAASTFFKTTVRRALVCT
jgi:hypothetical protein